MTPCLLHVYPRLQLQHSVFLGQMSVRCIFIYWFLKMTHVSNFALHFAKDNALHRKLGEPELELAIMRSQRSLVLEAAAQGQNCQKKQDVG